MSLHAAIGETCPHWSSVCYITTTPVIITWNHIAYAGELIRP